MRNKIRVIAKFGKKATKKVASGNLRYKGKTPAHYSRQAVIYMAKNGPIEFLRRLKQEMLQIAGRQGNNLVFPNGLVSGVSQQTVNVWYKKEAKPVTIVIPSYNDLEVLAPCIRSIKETTNPKYAQVIIVDDYCQEDNRQKLRELEDEQVKVVFREKNGGFAKAVNTGLRAANKKEDVILLNSDIIAHSNWLEALQYGAYEFGVDTGVVGPKLLYPDGRIQSGGTFRNTESPEWFDHYYRFQDTNYGPANIPQYCLAMTGACMYIKREFLNNVGLLDEKFQFAFEDVDWCLRGWEHGYRSLYFPAATLTHVESATRAKNKTMSVKEKQSIDYFWNKWGDWFDHRKVTNIDGQRRIIIVLQSFGLSGGIKNLFELANRLSKSDFQVEIWGLDKHQPAWEVSEELKIRTFKNYDRLISALAPQEAIKVATWWETAFPVWLSSITKGVPVYFISEYETWFYPDDLVAQASVVSCYRKEFRNITISPYNLDELRSIGLDATLIPCGYDDTTYKVLKDVKREEDTLLAVGRTFFQKNFELTYKAWKNLAAQRPKMWLYGFEPELAKRDSRIEYFTKPSNEEVNELYNKATAFIQTSRHEGFCLPVLEAMAAGCPVITTDSHGNRGFCFDGKNCLMVKQDDVEGTAKAIDRIMTDKPLRDKLARAALETVKDYRWDAVTKKAADFFSKVR
jgi:GT2 family glycosyltransferase